MSKESEEFLESKGWNKNNPIIGGALFKGLTELLDAYEVQLKKKKKDSKADVLLNFIQWRKQVAVTDLNDKEIVEFYLTNH